jgi:hypothetical protein
VGHSSLDELRASVLAPAPKIREIIVDAPRLANGVESLETDRMDILAAFDRLADRVSEHRQRAADLLYQAYGVDLGGET